MANVVIEDVEIGLAKLAHWLVSVKQVVLKGPALLTALGNLLVAVDKVMADVQMDLSNPLALINIAIPAQQITDLKTVWADLKVLFADAGIKI